jgi:hypothetical protein
MIQILDVSGALGSKFRMVLTVAQWYVGCARRKK